MNKYFTPARRAYVAVALLRVLVGAFFIYDGYTKLNDPNFAVRLPSMLAGWSANNPIFFYQDLLNLLIIPNGWFFAPIVIYSELLVGVGYVLGAFMPIMILVQAFLNLNFLMAAQHTHPSELLVNMAFLAMALVLYVSGAGNHYGLDHWLKPYLPFGNLKKKKRKPAKNKAQKKAQVSRSLKKKVNSRDNFEDDHHWDDSDDSIDPDWDVGENEDSDKDIDLVELAEMKKRKKRQKATQL